MFQKLTHFVKYHNALPIALSLVLISSGAALAASPEVRGAVVSSEAKIQSIDNSFIVNTNLDTFSPSVQIANVIEDIDAYYISYRLTTINVIDGVWQETFSEKELTIQKDILGGEDLGLFVAEQLNEVVDRQFSYLREAQEKERNKGKTNKVVTTTYSGLIGKFLDSKEDVIEGYTPVIQKKVTVVQTNNNPPNATTENTPASVTTSQTQQTASVSNSQPQQTTPVSNSNNPKINNSSSPVITIVGNNPASIKVRSSYVDLGAMVTDDVDHNLGIYYSVDGKEVKYVKIDTTEDATYTVTYTSTDQLGNIGIAERTVIVGTGIKKEVVVESVSTSTPATATSTATTTVVQ
ncbi:immunoglobulin-like domain-containing protein [candidate division KSB1 bacterium]